jgi:tripartite-type tricarboxylate transporter receptor subunit TctC
MDGSTARNLTRRRALGAAVVAASGALAPATPTPGGSAARAQGAAPPRAAGTDYPSRPVRVVVAFAAGGNADITARLISGALSAQTGQQFVVENRPGGGGVVALQALAQAPPDGHTLFVGGISTHALNLGLYKNLPVHTLTGVENITVSSLAPMALVVHPALPARTLGEFRDLLRREPGRLQYASPGSGSAGHIAAALLLQQLGGEGLHVPYRGSAPAFNDLLAGRIDFVVETVSFVAPHVRQGAVRALLVGAKERSALMPEAPSAPEAGLPQYEATTWTPWSAPQGTPAPIVRFLYEQIQVALRSEEVAAKLREIGNEPMPGMDPERTRAFIAAEIDKWVPIVRATGATID